MNPSVRSFLFLLAGLLAGSVLGYLAAPSESAQRPVDAAGASLGAALGPGASPAASQPDVALAPAAASARSVAPAREAEVHVDEERVLATARAEIARAEPQQASASAGEGAVGGRVLDHAGAPVAGVQVELLPADGQAREARSLDTLGRLEPVGNLEDAVLDSARDFARREGGRRIAETAADGEFRIEGLGQGFWSIRAAAPGWRVTRAQAVPHRIATDARVDFEAVRCSTVELMVLDAVGEPCESATLELMSSGSRGAQHVHYEWSPASPSIELPPGLHTLRAISEPRAWSVHANKWLSDLASDALELELLLDDPSRSETLRLRARTGVFGRVVPEGGGPIGDSPRVILRELTPGQDPAEATYGHEDAYVYCSQDASYAFLDLEPGRYGVAYVLGWNEDPVLVEAVEVEAGLVARDLHPDSLTKPRYVTVQVLDASGERVRGVHFSFLRTEGNSSHSGGTNSEIGPLGDYRVKLDGKNAQEYWSEDTECEFSLSVRAEDRANVQVELEPGQERVEVELDPPTNLEVLVLGYEPARFKGRLRVAVQEATGDAHSMHYFGGMNGAGAVDSRGVQRLDGLSPGDKLVLLKLSNKDDDHGWNAKTLLQRELRLTPGENRIELPMPGLGDLRIEAPDLEPGTHFWLRDSDQNHIAGQQLDDDRVCLFEELPHGEYVLQANGVSGTQEVRIPSGTVTFAPAQPIAMRLTKLPSDHPLATAGLRVGDLILEVDGKSASESTLWSSVYALTTNSSATVAVLYERDGERASLDLSAADVGGELDTEGLSIEPVFE